MAQLVRYDGQHYGWHWCSGCRRSTYGSPAVEYGQVFIVRQNHCDEMGHDRWSFDAGMCDALSALLRVGGWPAIEDAGWEWWQSARDR